MAVDIFDCLNKKLSKEKNVLVEFFEELRNQFIKILNEIARLYVFHHPERIPYEGVLTRNGEHVPARAREDPGAREAAGARGAGAGPTEGHHSG